jgi:hypothetical protein
MCGVLALPMLFGALLGLMTIVDGITATDSDKRASNLIFGTLALLIAGGMAFLFLMGGFGLLRAGNPVPAQMAAVFTCFVIAGAARRAIRFGSGPELIEFTVWLIAIAGVITILVLANRRAAKEWLAMEKRRWLAERAAKRGHQQRY